jgi:hypothetical protein
VAAELKIVSWHSIYQPIREGGDSGVPVRSANPVAGVAAFIAAAEQTAGAGIDRQLQPARRFLLTVVR